MRQSARPQAVQRQPATVFLLVACNFFSTCIPAVSQISTLELTVDVLALWFPEDRK